jgi:hypothetical protein
MPTPYSSYNLSSLNLTKEEKKRKTYAGSRGKEENEVIRARLVELIHIFLAD